MVLTRMRTTKPRSRHTSTTELMMESQWICRTRYIRTEERVLRAKDMVVAKPISTTKKFTLEDRGGQGRGTQHCKTRWALLLGLHLDYR